MERKRFGTITNHFVPSFLALVSITDNSIPSNNPLTTQHDLINVSSKHTTQLEARTPSLSTQNWILKANKTKQNGSHTFFLSLLLLLFNPCILHRSGSTRESSSWPCLWEPCGFITIRSWILPSQNTWTECEEPMCCFI